MLLAAAGALLLLGTDVSSRESSLPLAVYKMMRKNFCKQNMEDSLGNCLSEGKEKICRDQKQKSTEAENKHILASSNLP